MQVASLTGLLKPARDNERPGPQRQSPPKRVVAGAFLLSVAAFVASTLLATSPLREVSVEARAISATAMPAVIALTTIRERLGELMSSLSTSIDTRAARMSNFERTVAEINAQAASYDAHAVLPKRREQWNHVRALVATVVANAQLVRDELARGNLAEARAHFDSDGPGTEAADKELWQLVMLNATDTEQFAHHIDQARRNATVLLLVMDAACVVFAVALTVLAVRAVTSHERIAERRLLELEQFAGRIAHDIRDPLSPIVFGLGVLAKGLESDDPRRALIDRTIRNVRRATTLVEDLLSFARAGGRPDRSARSSALTVARATVDDLTALAVEKAIEVRVDPDAGDVLVACPSGVLASLIGNLVHNAIKYMNAGQVRRVVVRIARKDHRARVEVEDTGPGVPPGAENDIFEPYVRADRSGVPGLGLGLATVKRLAEAYDGFVGVRSGANGCTFWFELPVASQ